ncbi:hypothetical protein FQA47_013450 [Oryzias melastigma]|uniref:Uncharacterized protein n=1 Tax=Oryzias melastigma TaxID=30732 RepID=A0A834FIP7_ORYME|nr:hypothetical protein FQA47_013450 [Oryzias melastigma]
MVPLHQSSGKGSYPYKYLPRRPYQAKIRNPRRLLWMTQADSNGMSSAVSESLEKMKENHSLFYKIACDISISDSDITKSDAQIASHPEEEVLITESSPKETTSNPEAEQTEKEKDGKVELQSSENSLCIQESPKKLEDRSIQDCELQIIEASLCCLGGF